MANAAGLTTFDRVASYVAQPSESEGDSFDLGPMRVQRLTLDAALDKVEAGMNQAEPCLVAFCNTNSTNHAYANPTYRAALSKMLVLNDGIGIELMARLTSGRGFPANLNGTDFIPHFLQSQRRPLRIFLLGAKPDVVEKAAKTFAAQFPRHRIVGYRDGYFDTHDEQAVVAEIAALRPDVLLVAMGNPWQELFMDRHAKDLNCRLVFGVGALFDYVSQATPRAPVWLRRARLEWAFRLAHEPRRLLRRYTIDILVFAWSVLKFRAQPSRELI
ncbi:exopolysaccharide biosynthesis WecB/TagA/CpsF family protein [Rhodoblastus acidophilus]|uniref:WecB/TagA/CpsF family glycosyltransferase n=1 Tax=Rhodoblastus acidophilus TaxID=1074 RepID=UPI00222564A6|nr:WecB/TagA/CpsF family glycosyltransferase [Rhodoblastus acidophilus]MCW2285943.1 exopolysaccharide biosynthesis WecB/TagA/CpsF family protein [Rhodoblastus acidophilus]MCW2334837.1 exopolysaccharide biosynthesis WecB/TagA/CpsF family protein [Rhodoblastus acidophilus]